MPVQGIINAPRLPHVAGRTGGCTALVTTRRDRSSLWSSMAIRTGNGSYDFAIRGECHYNLQSVINLCDIADLAARLLTASRSGRVQWLPIRSMTGRTPAV
jgi:hypothetical protein